MSFRLVVHGSPVDEITMWPGSPTSPGRPSSSTTRSGPPQTSQGSRPSCPLQLSPSGASGSSPSRWSALLLRPRDLQGREEGRSGSS